MEARNPPPMSESPSRGVFCCDLRSKKYFLLGRAPQQAEDYLDASRHCWCARTGETLGPDSQPAHPEDCHTRRACFRSFAARAGAR
jgi:hypothetical protein